MKFLYFLVIFLHFVKKILNSGNLIFYIKKLMKTKLHFVLSLSMFLSVFSVFAQQGYWQQSDKSTLNGNSEKTLNEKFYQTYQLNLDAFKAQLANAPMRSASTINSSTCLLYTF